MMACARERGGGESESEERRERKRDSSSLSFEDALEPFIFARHFFLEVEKNLFFPAHRSVPALVFFFLSYRRNACVSIISIRKQESIGIPAVTRDVSGSVD